MPAFDVALELARLWLTYANVGGAASQSRYELVGS